MFQLFVKNVPLNRSMEELKSMFSQFGKVHGVVPVASRKNVVYMVRTLISLGQWVSVPLHCVNALSWEVVWVGVVCSRVVP